MQFPVPRHRHKVGHSKLYERMKMACSPQANKGTILEKRHCIVPANCSQIMEENPQVDGHVVIVDETHQWPHLYPHPHTSLSITSTRQRLFQKTSNWTRLKFATKNNNWMITVVWSTVAFNKLIKLNLHSSTKRIDTQLERKCPNISKLMQHTHKNTSWTHRGNTSIFHWTYNALVETEIGALI